MRILHVMASRANGGAETYCGDMIASLHAAGLSQLAVLPRRALQHARLAAAGVVLAPEALDVRVGHWRRRRLARIIDGFGPDLVHCWMRRAASLVPALPVPVIGWLGGYYDPARFARCSHFIAVTPALIAHLAAHGVPAGCAHYVPTFPTLEAGPPVDRAALDTPAGAPVLLALSRLHHKKGLDVLLRALCELPRCVAWLAGDGPLAGELHALAQRPRGPAAGRGYLRAALALGAVRHRHAGSLGGGAAARGGRQPGSVGPDQGWRERPAGADR